MSAYVVCDDSVFIVLIAKIEMILTELPNIDIDPFMLTMGLIAACKPT